ncbi:hypothetical protein QJS04_geneDACA021494 [Acorus gramineus]|uniref:RING-type domain-containing protein n=1 Tax=Acorus gramineus TaxID=55184 RepID=A0AAV9A6Z8_ACOGR|nr:hypothetical protein QJS04_geneDACA021494 [Acorus gramineus]
MEVEKTDFSGEGKGSSSAPCSICLELVVDRGGERSIAKLQCGHEFHLDCIGSAFNAKGAMQCPNCRKVEKGRWLYANGYCSFPEFNVDDLVNEELYDLGYPEMPFGLQWCPFSGFAQLAFEEGDQRPNAYHDLLGGAAFGDHPGASISAHVCPYLALHGYSHIMHRAPSNAMEPVPDSGLYRRHPSGAGGPSSNEVLSSHGFPASEPPRHHNWPAHAPSFPVSGSLLDSVDQSGPQLISRLSRNNTSSHQRVVVRPPVVGDVRGQTRLHGSRRYSQSASTSSTSLHGAHFAQVRRMRPGELAFISSTASTASLSEPGGGFYRFSLNRAAHLDGDRLYGWGGQEGLGAPLPWIPIEEESQWWAPPVHRNQNHQLGSGDSTGRNYFPQRVVSERVAHGGGHPRGGFLPRMTPFM